MLREKEKKARTPEKPAPRPTEKNGHGLNGYRPSEKEPFMNERQREYFRAKLLIWKDEILKKRAKHSSTFRTKTRTSRPR